MVSNKRVLLCDQHLRLPNLRAMYSPNVLKAYTNKKANMSAMTLSVWLVPNLCCILIQNPVPPTSTDTSVFIRNLRALYRYTETTRYDLQSACTGAPSASGRKRLRATSPAWCQCSSCSTFVGVSGDGMQEPPNESDASVSTLIIVFGAMLFTRCLLHLPVLVIYTVLDTDIGSINQSKSTEHKFGGLEAL